MTPSPTTQATYPATKLQILPTSTRGTGDPPYDPSRRPKYWKDPDKGQLDPGQFVSYNVLHQAPDGSWSVIAIWMPAGEAATTNFPDPPPPGQTLVNYTPPNLPAAWGVPVRPFLTDATGHIIEKLVPTPFGLLVQRTDIVVTPSNWTTDDEALLHSISDRVDRILAKLP